MKRRCRPGMGRPGRWVALLPALATFTGCGPEGTARAPGDRLAAGASTTPALPAASNGAAVGPDESPPPGLTSASPPIVASAAPTAPAAPLPAPAFPPPRVPPPHARTASPGDGEWVALGDPARRERAATTPPIVFRTVLHPHPESRWVTVTLGAVDLTRTRVHLVPGTEDLVWAKKKPGPGAGLVPAEHREALAVVLNGGFQPKHGRWGLVAGDVSVAPPRPGGCTLGLDADGAMTLGPWQAMEPGLSAFVSIRQTVPCLVENGSVHASLLAGRDAAWKGQVADVTTRRRSAIGVDRERKVLYFAMGEEAPARWLAEGLLLAGAHAGAQLDINWYWTRFLLFGETDEGVPRVTSTLIPKMEHQANGYVERPSTRDFFYITKR